jgi:hypothetical protein
MSWRRAGRCPALAARHTSSASDIHLQLSALDTCNYDERARPTDRRTADGQRAARLIETYANVLGPFVGDRQAFCFSRGQQVAPVSAAGANGCCALLA